MTRLVFSFGCPRAGTTFLHRALSPVDGTKIHEGSMVHPCRSNSGLIELSRLFRDRPITVARIVRHPVEIAASFVAARDTEAFGDEMEGIRTHDDDAVVGFIRGESIGARAQRDHFDAVSWDHRYVEVRYERLSDADYRADVAVLLGGDKREAVRRGLDRFGAEPVRSGRLSAGITDVFDADERETWAGWLDDVIVREGYE